MNHVRYIRPKELNARNADVQPLKDSIQALVNAYKLQGKLNEVNVVASWEKIMGKAVALKTQEIFFKNNKLYVRLTSAPLKHELNMAKAKVADMINREMNVQVVEEVVFL